MRITLAGAESPTMLSTLITVGVPNILMSYYYLRKQSDQGEEVIRRAKERNMWVLVDSGAHTFFRKYPWLDPRGDMAFSQGDKDDVAEKKAAFLAQYTSPEEAQKSIDDDFETYQLEYEQWALRFAGKVDLIAELDVQALIGQERVWEWRERWRGYGLSVLVTAHQMPGQEAREAMPEYDRLVNDGFWTYIGLSGTAKLAWFTEFFNTFKERLVENKIKVHGWAQTNLDSIRKFPFASIDSSVGADTLVWVDDPIRGRQVIPISELFDQGHSIKVRGSEEKAFLRDYTTQTVVKVGSEYRVKDSPLSGVVRHTVVKPYYRVTTDLGRQIDITGDHSIFTMDANGRLVETRIGDLKIGDFIVAPKTMKWGGQGLEAIHATIEKRIGHRAGVTVTKHDVAIPLDSQILEFFGNWLADGSYGGGRTTVQISTGGDKETIDLCQRVAARYEAKLSRRDKGDVGFCSQELVPAMKAIGLVGKSSSKQLPAWFWQLSESQACHMLKGLYSGDGSAGKSITYSSISKRLRDGVAEAVSALLGCPVSISSTSTKKSGFRPSTGTAYVVTIASDFLKSLFMRKIGFIQTRKKPSYSQKERRPYITDLPAHLLVKTVYRPGTKWKQPFKTSYKNGQARIGAWAKDGFVPEVLSPDLIFLQITRIEELPLQERIVYDLDVPETQKFCGNGILAHNTSWLMGGKYGVTYYYRLGSHRMQSYDQKDVRTKWKTDCETLGVNYDEFIADKWQAVDAWNANMWKMLSEDMLIDTTNAYWLTEDEKSIIVDKARERTRPDKAEIRLPAKIRERTTIVAVGQDPRQELGRLCNLCFIRDKCPTYERDATCNLSFRPELRSKGALAQFLKQMLEFGGDRVMQAMFIERVQGGYLDEVVSKELVRYVDLCSKVKDLFDPQDEVTITAKGSGAISKLFGSMLAEKKPEPTTEAITVMAEPLDRDEIIDLESTSKD